MNIEILTTPSSCYSGCCLPLLFGKQASSAQPCIGMAFMETNELLIRFFLSLVRVEFIDTGYSISYRLVRNVHFNSILDSIEKMNKSFFFHSLTLIHSLCFSVYRSLKRFYSL